MDCKFNSGRVKYVLNVQPELENFNVKLKILLICLFLKGDVQFLYSYMYFV